MSSSYIIYSTEGCHLCDLAQDVIAQLDLLAQCEVTDIAESADLVEEFGIRIPVVQAKATQACLDWPFDAEQLAHFIKNNS
jgi:hypothetical protein